MDGRGVFATPSKSQASVYSAMAGGARYTVWPKGKFKFVWSNIHDLYIEVKSLAHGWTSEVSSGELQQLVNQYKSRSLKDAIWAGNDVAILCSSYYLLSEEHSDELTL